MIPQAVIAAGMAALGGLGPPVGETLLERAVRLATVEVSIAEAACAVREAGDWPGTERELAASLIAVGRFESGWALNVHAGKCKPWECDAVRTRSGVIVHRAASLWQLHATGELPPAEWRATIGTGALPTSKAAHAAAATLARSRRHCRGGSRSWAGRMVSLYATGKTCQWSGAAGRVRAIWRVVSALEAAA